MLCLAVLAVLLVPLIPGDSPDVAATATRATLRNLAAAVARYQADHAGRLPGPGAAGLDAGRRDAPQLRYLFLNPGPVEEWAGPGPDPSETAIASFDPRTKTGWKGPYLSGGETYPFLDGDKYGFSAWYGEPGDPCVFDSFPHPAGRRCPVVLVSRPVDGVVYSWLQSAGPNGILEVPGIMTGPPVPYGTRTVFPGFTVPVDDLICLVPAR